MRFLLIVLFCFSNLASAQAQELKKLEYGASYRLHSEIMEMEVDFDISLPESFNDDSEEHTYPVVFVFEEHFFQLTSGIVNHLTSVSRMPKSIVVSLNSDFPTPKTFTNGSKFWPSDWEEMPLERIGDEFPAFMEDELMPYLESKFRAANYKIGIGFSGSAILPLHIFDKWPDLFQATVAIAAGDILTMGPEKGVRFIDRFEQNFKGNPNRKTNLFVASADSDVDYTIQIEENINELREKLSPFAANNLKLVSKVYENEEHYDIAVKAIPEAFEMIFPREKWSLKYREIIKLKGNALANIDRLYETLSEEYGYKVLPIADRWNSVNSLRFIGMDLQRNDRLEEAIEVMERRVSYEPKSLEGWLALAQAYEQHEEFQKSLKSLEKLEKLDRSNTYLSVIEEARKRMLKE